MKILVFLHGTAIMHASAVGRLRERRVRQVVDGDPSVRDFASYVPTDAAVAKLQSWVRQGAHLSYLSSHRKPSLIDLDAAVLRRHAFPDGPIFHRGLLSTYAGIVAKLKPDILIEDDCESIGGLPNMIFPNLSPGLQARLKSIVVPEFGGLAHLPDDLQTLRQA